jgi:hypothetical protein
MAEWHGYSLVRHNHQKCQRGGGGLNDRMTVILEQQDWPAWLGEADEAAETGW